MDFAFTLTFKLDEHDALIDAVLQRLDATGFPDTLVGAGVTGLVELQFISRASTAEGALEAAKRSVLRALPAALLVRVEGAPDTPISDDESEGPQY